MNFDHQVKESVSPLQEHALKEVYASLYTLVKAKSKDPFIFTSSGTEGVNHAVFSAYVDITRKTGKNHFLCSNIDEAAAIMAMSRLQDFGCLFQMVEANREGYVTKQAVAEALTPRTAMLSMSWANGLTGVIQPVHEIAELCQERGILFHVEATHVLGKGEFTFDGSGADLLTFNGYHGSGGMFIREGLEISPFILGGNEQGEMRGGELNLAALFDLGRAAQKSIENVDHYCMEVARLRACFEELLCKAVPHVQILFKDQERLPHITCALFPGVTSDALLYLLHQKRVYATFGGNHFQHLVHILTACAIHEPACHSGLSFAFSHETTEEEIEKGVEIIAQTVQQLQKYSTHLLQEVS